MRKLAGLIVMFFVLSSILIGCGGSQTPAVNPTQAQSKTEPANGEKIKIVVAHVLAETHPANKALEFFKQDLEKAMRGKFEVELSHSGKLGAEQDLVKKLQEGTLEMAAVTTGTLGAIDPNYGVFDLPYIIKDYASADAILDGEIGMGLLKGFDKYGLVGLAWEENGFRQLSANKEITKPSDMKDIKIRTMQNEIQLKYFETLGAKPASLPFTQLYQALKSGAFEAQDNPNANTALSKLFEVQKFVMQTDYVYSPIVVLASKVFWNKLSDAEKKVISDAAYAQRIKQREFNRTDQLAYIDIMTKGGTTYIKLTDAEKAEFKKEAEKIYPEFENKIGKELVDKVKKAGGWW